MNPGVHTYRKKNYQTKTEESPKLREDEYLDGNQNESNTKAGIEIAEESAKGHPNKHNMKG